MYAIVSRVVKVLIDYNKRQSIVYQVRWLLYKLILYSQCEFTSYVDFMYLAHSGMNSVHKQTAPIANIHLPLMEFDNKYIRARNETGVVPLIKYT